MAEFHGARGRSTVNLNFRACLDEASQAFGHEFATYVCNYSQLRKSIPTETADSQVSLSNIVNNFGKLSGALAGMHHTQGPSAKFVTALDGELRRVVGLITSFFDELMLDLYDEYHKLRTFSDTRDDLYSLRKHHALEFIGERLRCFDHFRKWNTYAFRRLATKFDEFIQKSLNKVQHATTAWVESRLKETLHGLNLEGGLVLYSMCHHLKRQHLEWKSSESLSVNVIQHGDLEAINNFESYVGDDKTYGLDEDELIKLAKETGIKLGPAMENALPVNNTISPKQISGDNDVKKHMTLSPGTKADVEPRTHSKQSIPATPGQVDATTIQFLPDHNASPSAECGPLGGPSVAPPLEFDDINDDDISSVHESFEETTSFEQSATEDAMAPVSPSKTARPGLNGRAGKHGKLAATAQSVDSSLAGTTPLVASPILPQREPLEPVKPAIKYSSANGTEDQPVGHNSGQDTELAPLCTDKKIHTRTTRRVLVPPDDKMSVKVVLCRYLAMLNFTVELQVLRYYKLLLNLKDKAMKEGKYHEGHQLSEVLSHSKGMAKLLPSKGLASCAEKKRNIHMAFLDSEDLAGYMDLLADSDYRVRNHQRPAKDEISRSPKGESDPCTNLCSADPSPVRMRHPERISNDDYVCITSSEEAKGNDAPLEIEPPSKEQQRKKHAVDKARLWRLRWSDDWNYHPQKMVLVERIDYADADSKSRSASGQSAYADCPGGTFRDPSCPGTGEYSIPTIEEIVEEGVYGVGLEARDLKALLSAPEGFDLERCAEYYAATYCKRLAPDVVVGHFKKVLESLRKAVMQYGIRPVLQTWSKRDMFVFTDPLRERHIDAGAPGELSLANRSEWSHAAEISSSTLVMVDEDVTYVDQYDTYFDHHGQSPTSRKHHNIAKEPIMSPAEAYKRGVTWNFPLLVVRIHGREERCSAVASLINNTSLRAAEVYGLSSYAHGIAQLVAPHINAQRATKDDDFTALRCPSWMSFTDMIQTAEANLVRQMKDQKIIIKQSRRNTAVEVVTEATDLSDQRELAQYHSGVNTDNFDIKHNKGTTNLTERRDRAPSPRSPEYEINEPLKPEAISLPASKKNIAVPSHRKIYDLLTVKASKIDDVDGDLWTDLQSCREEMDMIQAPAHYLALPSNAQGNSQAPTIIAAFDSTIHNLTEPLVRNNQPTKQNSKTSWLEYIMGNVTAILGVDKEKDHEQDVAQTSIVRVEPKAFFANERTLLQWMNICVLLTTISVTLLSLEGRTAYVAGTCLAAIAIFFLIYSYSIYTKRNKALINREPIKYADELGPFLLMVSLVMALSIILIMNIHEKTFYGTAPPTFKHLTTPK